MARSEPANAELRERSRERIMDAALEVFAERGYRGATVSQIVARAEVSRGLLAYYFATKQELFEAILVRWLHEAAVDAATLPAEATPDQRLRAAIDQILRAAWKTLPTQRLLICLMLQPGARELLGRFEREHAAVMESFEDSLRAVFAERGAANPALEEVLLRSLVEGIVIRLAGHQDTYPLERARARLLQWYGLEAGTPLFAPADGVSE